MPGARSSPTAQLLSPARSERAAALTIVVMIHIALFAILLSVRNPPAPAQPKPGTLALISLTPEAPAQARPPPPRLPSKLADTRMPMVEPAFSTDVDSTASAVAGGCGTLDLVSKALVADPAALAAAHDAPPETRSIADAVVLWNAGWSPAASTADAPLGPARSVVEQSLGSIEDSCLDEQIVGPRLVPIPIGEQGTMFLVLGSGIWSWRQLMLDNIIAEDSNPGDQQPFDPFDWF